MREQSLRHLEERDDDDDDEEEEDGESDEESDDDHSSHNSTPDKQAPTISTSKELEEAKAMQKKVKVALRQK